MICEGLSGSHSHVTHWNVDRKLKSLLLEFYSQVGRDVECQRDGLHSLEGARPLGSLEKTVGWVRNQKCACSIMEMARQKQRRETYFWIQKPVRNISEMPHDNGKAKGDPESSRGWETDCLGTDTGRALGLRKWALGREREAGVQSICQTSLAVVSTSSRDLCDLTGVKCANRQSAWCETLLLTSIERDQGTMGVGELGSALHQNMFGYYNASKLLFLQQLNVPCFWDQFAIFLQLFFLGSLSVQFLQKQITQLCSSKEKELQNCGSNKWKHFLINYSTMYRASLGCSILVLATHLLMLLLLLLKGLEGSCRSIQVHLLSEIIQVISWLVSSLMVSHFPKQRTLKVPWVLRVWWILSFFQLLTETGIDIYSSMTYHSIPSIRDCAVFLNLGLCTYLSGISLIGSTGISLSTNDITDPLLYGSSEKHIAGKKQSPYAKANILQLITFSWLNPLFAVGINKPLEQEDVPDLHCRDSAEFLSHSFSDKLNFMRDAAGPKTPSIYKVIVLFIWKKAAINALFAVISESTSYVGPYLIDDFVKFLSKKPRQSLVSGYVLALAFLSAKMIETVAQRQWVFGARQLGMRLRAALISHIYKKGLCLSSQSRQSHTSGEIINYMSVDIQRITNFVWYLNIIWMLPIQISLAIYILHMNLGLGSFAGLAATALVMTCNVPITTIQKRFQSKIMESKDDRMKATSEVLRNMKILKLQTWDSKYLHKLESLRKVENNWIWKSLRLSAISAFIFWGAPTFISIITFGTCILIGIPLTAGRVLSALATFRMLQDPIFSLPDLLQVLAQAKVSVDRVASYLQEDEIQSDAVEFIPRNEADFAVEINDGKFSWNLDSGTPTLSSINLKVIRGKKVAICGTVGSGKSSLLSAILGEIQKKSGTVKICGTKAYVPQSPWILTGNIRENILFGNPFDCTKYDKTIQACALEKDFELFSSGDLTEIGERGINMSGGQKQRIQIARAAYQDADIYLLDDPFSAVDAHTGTQLFKDCLMGILKDKTILYVTHQVEFLPAADLILVMQDGRIAQAGRFEELLQQNIGFEVLVGAHSQALETVLNAENSTKIQFSEGKKNETPNETDIDIEAAPQVADCSRSESEQNLCPNTSDKGGKLVQDEEREKGSIGKEIYLSYLTAVKGGALVPVIILTQSSFQVLQVASNYWMAWASPPTTGSKPIVGTTVLFSVYILLSVGSSLCVLLRAMLVAITGLLTSEKFFTGMLHSMLRAPMSFFDSTPTGRILNRASTDQSVLDLEIATNLGWCAFSIIQIMGAMAVMSQAAWQVFLLFIPVTAICIWYQRYYIPTARELARLSGIQRAPILHHFSESLSGAATIRAFAQEDRFVYANLSLIDNHSRPWFHNVSAMEWLSFRLNLLSNFVFAFCLVLLVSLPDGIINPSIAGLAVTYGLNLNVLQASIIWNMCNAENKMISVERILQYSKITSEAPLVIEDCRPPDTWPERGTICFKNLQIRYAEHLPSVLKNITCTFPGQKKVGVVGRTGSGKSTLIQAIFRIVEPREGTIEIDDVDICKIGLHDLRGRLSIIPQDPTMFEGTIRGNLDPLAQYSDHEVWAALDKCQLGELVRAKEKKLDATVVENGENWSVGQRQLVCLGRALLKRSSILVLDEATASVDSATDGTIQKIIRQEFNERTVVTIAHRIHTVIDSDLVLVLSEGRIQEFDTPARLLEREDSSFSKLIKESKFQEIHTQKTSKSRPSLHVLLATIKNAFQRSERVVLRKLALNAVTKILSIRQPFLKIGKKNPPPAASHHLKNKNTSAEGPSHPAALLKRFKLLAWMTKSEFWNECAQTVTTLVGRTKVFVFHVYQLVDVADERVELPRSNCGTDSLQQLRINPQNRNHDPLFVVVVELGGGPGTPLLDPSKGIAAFPWLPLLMARLSRSTTELSGIVRRLLTGADAAVHVGRYNWPVGLFLLNPSGEKKGEGRRKAELHISFISFRDLPIWDHELERGGFRRLVTGGLVDIGLAMVGYGIYLVVEWKRVSSHSVTVSPLDHPELMTLGRPMMLVVSLSANILDKLPRAWFIYLFIAVGVILFVISCFGCIGAATRNGCCLSCYSVLVILLILVEVGCAAFIFFDHSWKEVIPTDKTGNFDMINDFLEKNWNIARWVALGAVVLQVLSFILALVIRAANRPPEYDSDDEYIAPRSTIRQPLVSRQGAAATGIPVTGTLENRPNRSDAWSTRMREKYGLDTSEFTYNPSESNRYQQATAPPAEERSVCTVM
ncbi:hypothetical protein H6P81_005134 [Aristolochia fimbriata]|uniref:ABC transporter C family member 15 n=1 Tax=Aristolochia fimbriata TaxID=158543 RepID=A0AAV7EVU6_ARIFI|nr:hypothetical protein H6P81_005134 [Aristolochia fimbriata]